MLLQPSLRKILLPYARPKQQEIRNLLEGFHRLKPTPIFAVLPFRAALEFTYSDLSLETLGERVLRQAQGAHFGFLRDGEQRRTVNEVEAWRSRSRGRAG